MKEEWIDVADAHDLSIGQMTRLDLGDRRILIARSESGIYAVDDLCSHEEVSLYLGCVQGDNIKCSLHGSRFSLITGEPLEEPATEAIRTYPVRSQGGKFQVKLTVP